jgi:hypothetical protein
MLPAVRVPAGLRACRLSGERLMSHMVPPILLQEPADRGTPAGNALVTKQAWFTRAADTAAMSLLSLSGLSRAIF